MDLGIIADLPLITLWLCVAVALIAGVVKGAIGFAMPLIMVSGISSLTDPKTAIAALIVPVVLSNGLQIFRQGMDEAVKAVKDYWRYILIVCVAIFVTAQLLAQMPNRPFYFVLGIPVVVLSIVQLVGYRPVIPEENRRKAEWGVGLISGILGGLAGTWGPTTVLYLIATDTPKNKQIVVQGVVYGLGAIVLLAAHLQSGIFNGETAPLSFMMIPAALLGMWVGFKLQDRMDKDRFRTITLIVLVIVGLNLLRKGFLG